MPEHEIKQAAALRYDSHKDIAPRIVATGRGFIAQRILEVAKEANVPIVQDNDLAALLAELDIAEEIPEPLYRAVAEVLAFLYRVNRDCERKQRGGV
jgi:flagellar biosynthesis protein